MSDPKLVHTGITDLLPMHREPGLHISTIIREISIGLGHFKPDPIDSGVISPELQTRWELGSAFEDAIADSLAKRYQRSDPSRYFRMDNLEHDGLIGNPDLLEIDDRGLIVHEMKLTWLSSRHDPEGEKFWKYWVQIMAYCYMLETNLCKLHVCHINGNYRDERGPTYNIWEREFDEFELEANWRTLVTHGEKLGKEHYE